MATVRLVNVVKKFGEVVAVDHVNLEIKDKEFFILLGPSGSGKTTILRLIAGLERPTEGEIYIDDVLVNDIPPKDRDIAMVFQNYALYPHMTVEENISFALRLRKMSTEEIERRVREVARMLEIEHLLDRKPAQLSGGQQQRVALARAIVREPKVFLMDEPLSNLDAKLRVQMRSELKKLQRRLEITTVYVTHDQVEAMTMADRIGVINEGKLQQVGTPEEVYSKPRNLFVAGFIGSPPMNFIDVILKEEEGKLWAEFEGVRVLVPQEFYEALRDYVGRQVIMGIRPENLYDRMFAVNPSPYNTVRFKVDIVEPLGAEKILYLSLGNLNVVARVTPATKVKEGQEIDIVFDMYSAHFFDKDTGEAIIRFFQPFQKLFLESFLK